MVPVLRGTSNFFHASYLSKCISRIKVYDFTRRILLSYDINLKGNAGFIMGYQILSETFRFIYLIFLCSLKRFLSASASFSVGSGMSSSFCNSEGCLF